MVLLQLVALPAELPVEVYLKIPLGREIEMQPNTWSLNKRLIRVNPMGQRTHPKVKQTQKGGKRRGRKRSRREDAPVDSDSEGGEEGIHYAS